MHLIRPKTYKFNLLILCYWLIQCHLAFANSYYMPQPQAQMQQQQHQQHSNQQQPIANNNAAATTSTATAVPVSWAFDKPITSNNLHLTQNLQSNQYIKTTYELLLDLRQQMLTRSIKFDEHFRHLLSCSKRSLHSMFLETYGLMYEHNTEIFTSMFEVLEQYYAYGQIKLTKSMETFFERLYQKIFQVYNTNMRFDANYLECVTDQLSDLKPFKDVPEKLIDGIRHSFVAARTFVQALNNGIDIIKSIISLGQTAQCTHMINEKLLKNTLNTGANNQQIRQPCLGYCEQVINRCMGNGILESLNDKWKSYVVVLSELAMKLSTSYNIETIIAPLDVQISEAIMNFQENAVNISHHVFQVCGHPSSIAELQLSTSRPPHRIRRRAANPGPVISGAIYQNRHNQNNLGSMHQSHGSQWPPARRDSMSIGLPHIQDDLTLKGQKSPLIIDEIKNYMLTTKSFWHNLPNAVCTSNYTLGSNPGRKQSNCLHDKFDISDINSDLRFRAEMYQQITRLETTRSKIESALAGIEVDWSSNSDQGRIKNPSFMENGNVRPTIITSTTSTTTTTMEPTTEDDEEDPGDSGDSLDPGSGEYPDQAIHDPIEPEDPYEESTTDVEDQEESVTPDEFSTEDTSTEPPSINELGSNSIESQPTGLITPPNQDAQRSSQYSNKLLISYEHHILFASLISIALLLLNYLSNNQAFAHK